MIIRLVSEDDLPTCGKIYAEAFAAAPYYGEWTAESASEMLSGLLERDPLHCWILEKDGTVVGFAFCTTFGKFRGTIQEFAVAPNFQKHGYGSKLMEHILAQFKNEGIQNADLIANLDANAYRFYEKYGFRRPSRYTVMARPLL